MKDRPVEMEGTKYLTTSIMLRRKTTDIVFAIILGRGGGLKEIDTDGKRCRRNWDLQIVFLVDVRQTRSRSVMYCATRRHKREGLNEGYGQNNLVCVALRD